MTNADKVYVFLKKNKNYRSTVNDATTDGL